MRESNPELHRQRVSASLLGKTGIEARRWLGDKASYYAKHMWVLKHFGKANHCDFDPSHTARCFEWAHKKHSESRNREDYFQLCSSCHRKFNAPKYCPHGHEYTPENTIYNCRGHRLCRKCLEGKVNVTNN